MSHPGQVHVYARVSSQGQEDGYSLETQESACREWAAARGKDHGMNFAEGFKVVSLESDEDWAKYKGNVFGRS